MFMFIIPMILFFTVESLLWKKNRKSPLQTLFGTTFWSLIAITIVFVTTLLNVDDPFVNFSWAVIGFISLQAGLVICNILLWVGVMKSLPLSIAEPTALSRVILLTILSVAIFGGDLGLLEILLVCGIFVSCVGLSFFQGKYKKREMDRNYIKGLFLLFLWVLTSVSINLIATHLLKPAAFGGLGVRPITQAATQVFLIFVITLVIFLIKQPKQLWTTVKESFDNKIHMCIGASGVFGRICFSIILATTAINVGILTAIQIATVALVVIYSVIFVKERPKILSYFFIAAIIACAVVLSL